MAMGTTSGCINHPGIEAVARCKQCGKAVCGTCVVKGPTGKFCTPECKEQHEGYIQRAQELDRMRKRPSLFVKLRGIIGTGIILVLVILAAGFVATYFGFNIPILTDIVNNLFNR